jgi:hypothetical protein
MGAIVPNLGSHVKPTLVLELVSRAGLEPGHYSESTQLIDFIKRQKRQNRYFRRSEVHGGYTEPHPRGVR